jgi:hypothetical protein
MIAHVGIKRILPNDDESKFKVSGARMKRVCRKAGEPERLPRATFEDRQGKRKLKEV